MVPAKWRRVDATEMLRPGLLAGVAVVVARATGVGALEPSAALTASVAGACSGLGANVFECATRGERRSRGRRRGDERAVERRSPSSASRPAARRCGELVLGGTGAMCAGEARRRRAQARPISCARSRRAGASRRLSRTRRSSSAAQRGGSSTSRRRPTPARTPTRRAQGSRTSRARSRSSGRAIGITPSRSLPARATSPARSRRSSATSPRRPATTSRAACST